MSSPRRVAKQHFSTSTDEQLLALDNLCVVELRVEEVFEGGLWPEWRRLYDRIAQGLVSGHRGCQAAYDAACRPLMPPLSKREEGAAESSYIVARIPAAGRIVCERVELAATWHGLFDLLKGVLPMHSARSNSEAQEKLRAQRILFEYRRSVSSARVDPLDAAAAEALLGYGLPKPDSKSPTLADAILLEIVTAASWAIDVMLAEHTVRRPSANEGIGFIQAFRALHPIVALSPRDNAIELNITAYVPSRLPDWVDRLASATDPSHLLVAANDAERIAQRLRAEF